MQELHESFMQIALAEAQKAYELGETPVGAVIVRDGAIIAKAHNLRETERDATAHAELLAIRQANQVLGGWRLTRCTLYVTLEPCPMCAGAIVQARIPHLVFGAYDPKSGACGSLMDLVRDERLNHQVEVTSGILADESSRLLRRFFAEFRERWPSG
ncbi:MAG: nucleoside deaminase [Firmicutes bacterium]|nr:nucleoside deaminase [Bacillota bacterium]